MLTTGDGQFPHDGCQTNSVTTRGGQRLLVSKVHRCPEESLNYIRYIYIGYVQLYDPYSTTVAVKTEVVSRAGGGSSYLLGYPLAPRSGFSSNRTYCARV